MSSSTSNTSTPSSSHTLTGTGGIFNSNSGSSTGGGLEDIQHLLYLETLKRFKDDEANIRRQVEEKMRQYQEAKVEYMELYAKYVSLMELVATRNAMEQGNFLDDSLVDATKANATSIVEMLSNCKLSDYIDSETLATCKQKLSIFEKYENLPKLKTEVMEMNSAVKRIQSHMECIENTLEAAITQGLDYMVDEVKVINEELDC